MHIEAQGLAEAIANMKGRTARVLALQPALEMFGADIVKRTDDSFMHQVDWDGNAFAPLADSTLEQRASRHAAGSGGIRAKRSALRAKMRGEGKRSRDIKKAVKRLNNDYQFKRIGFATGLTRKEQATALKRLRFAYTRANTAIRSSEMDAPTRLHELRKARAKYKRKRDKIISPAGIKILIDTARARNSNHVDRATRTSIEWSAVGYLGYHMAGTKRMPMRNPSAFVYEAGAWALHPKGAKLLASYVTSYVFRGEASNDNQSGGGAA